MRRGAPGVDDPLRNPLMIEVLDLFTQNEIFKQRRAASTCFERILVIGNTGALISGEDNAVSRSLLMRLAALRGRSRGGRLFLEHVAFLRHAQTLSFCGPDFCSAAHVSGG